MPRTPRDPRGWDVFNYVTGELLIHVNSERVARLLTGRSARWIGRLDYARPGEGWPL